MQKRREYYTRAFVNLSKTVDNKDQLDDVVRSVVMKSKLRQKAERLTRIVETF